MSFREVFEQYQWNDVFELVRSTRKPDVEEVLHRLQRSDGDAPAATLRDFAVLVSEPALEYLEPLAQMSRDRTLRRFGKTIQLYVPLYLSNECQNICTYCGFSLNNRIPRKTLSEAEILREVEVIKSYGYDHVLLVTGEAQKTVGIDYFREALKLLRPHFSQISLEVQPLEEDEYRLLAELGLHSVLVYQETYHLEEYRRHHPKGRKSNFWYRLDTPDRLGRAQIHKIGLGALIGLEDWRTDVWFAALHLSYLRSRYWRTKFSMSFPRLRPAEGLQEPKSVMSEAELVQLICAFRLFDENLELSLSTRERPAFRDHAIQLGVTSMSAGSRTEPGGYSRPEQALKQFSTSDERSPREVADMIVRSGYEPVWKDWDNVIGECAVNA